MSSLPLQHSNIGVCLWRLIYYRMANCAKHNEIFERSALGLTHLRLGSRTDVTCSKYVCHLGEMNRFSFGIDKELAFTIRVLTISR